MKLFRKSSATEPLDHLPFLSGVDLSDSFVRNWAVDADVLLFKLDASLWPSNANYDPPKPGEHTCYKPAVLTFLGISQLALPSQVQVAAAYDSIEDGYDTIDFISYDSRNGLWRVAVGSLGFVFGCCGVRFDVSAA